MALLLLALACTSEPDPLGPGPDGGFGIIEPPTIPAPPGGVQLWTAAQLAAGEVVPWGEIGINRAGTSLGESVEPLGDVDSDGVPDLWIRGEQEGVDVAWAMPALPGSERLPSATATLTPCLAPCAVVGDLNGDGGAEVAAEGKVHPSETLLRYTDLGIPTFSVSASVVALGEGQVAATLLGTTTVFEGPDLVEVLEHDVAPSFVADRDGDGLGDWIAAYGGQVSVYGGTRLTGPRLGPGDADETLVFDNDALVAHAGDLDGDGRDDLAVSTEGSIELPDLGLHLTWESRVARVLAANLDGDELGDLVLSAATPEGVEVALILGADLPEGGDVPLEDIAAQRLLWPATGGAAWVVGDIDGDGLDDWALGATGDAPPDPVRR